MGTKKKPAKAKSKASPKDIMVKFEVESNIHTFGDFKFNLGQIVKLANASPESETPTFTIIARKEYLAPKVESYLIAWRDAAGNYREIWDIVQNLQAA